MGVAISSLVLEKLPGTHRIVENFSSSINLTLALEKKYYTIADENDIRKSEQHVVKV